MRKIPWVLLLCISLLLLVSAGCSSSTTTVEKQYAVTIGDKQCASTSTAIEEAAALMTQLDQVVIEANDMAITTTKPSNNSVEEQFNAAPTPVIKTFGSIRSLYASLTWSAVTHHTNHQINAARHPDIGIQSGGHQAAITHDATAVRSFNNTTLFT